MVGRTAGATTHPSEPSLRAIASALEPAIRACDEQMEQERTIPPALVDALYEAGVFRTFLPRELGGLEVEPVAWLEMVEELSRINGSVGWLAMINAGATRLGREAMRAILAGPVRYIATSNVGRIGGRARKVEGGFRLSGRWPFASGSPHSTYHSGLAQVFDEADQPVPRPGSGGPWLIHATWPAADGEIIDTWDGLGMRGTGSHDLVIEDIFVPDERVSSNPRQRPYPGPLYCGQFLLMAHAAHALGIARAAIDAFVAIANRPPTPGSQRQAETGRTEGHRIAVAKADALVRAARLFAWDSTARAYAAAERDGAIPYELRILLCESMVFAVRSSKEAVDLVYEAGGASSVYRGTTLERCFRDIHTAAQHIIVTENRFEMPGRFHITNDQPGGPETDGFFAF
jgi:indole-3-acetate monooxygenase